MSMAVKAKTSPKRPYPSVPPDEQPGWWKWGFVYGSSANENAASISQIVSCRWL
jgi:hypothetical protein